MFYNMAVNKVKYTFKMFNRAENTTVCVTSSANSKKWIYQDIYRYIGFVVFHP